MVQLFQTLKSLLYVPSDVEAHEATIDQILQKGFPQIRNIDPDTHRQWLRLQQAVAQRDPEVAPARSRLIPRLAFVSAVAIVAALGVFAYFSFTGSTDTIATGRGEQKEVVLEDGSKVILSHTTEIVTAKMQPRKSRQVSLAGEAYFRARQGETPFIVSTEYADVQVVGTEFNIRAREGRLEVAVISGKVNVAAAKDGKESTLMLTQNQMALVLQGDVPKRLGDILSPEYPGWMHGKLFLNGTSFSEACREIEMRFDVRIKFNERSVQRDLITGILDARTAESALAALCEVTGKKFQHDGQTYHIY